MEPSLSAYKHSLLMIFPNAAFICPYKSVKRTFQRALAWFQTGLTFDMLTNDCRRWARRALQSLVTTPQPVQTDPVNALGSNQADRFGSPDWPSETQLKSMQAGLISLFFISNHLRSLKENCRSFGHPNSCTFTVFRITAWTASKSELTAILKSLQAFVRILHEMGW